MNGRGGGMFPGRGRSGGGGRGSFVGRGRGGGGGGGGREHYTNPCLTMHQPWASLLIAGIKRIEGRSWPAPITGRLWIHAASKVPEQETIKAMEDFYKEIYAVNGITDINFPEHYPVSRLLGCVDIVGCVKREELVCWDAVPESVRLEGLTDFCWLCENPQKLVIPFEMRGSQGVYNLERRIYNAAVAGLRSVQAPLPVKFPLPCPQDPFSLRPGSLKICAGKCSVEVTPEITAAIAGACSAATQFSRKVCNVTSIAKTDSKSQYQDSLPDETESSSSSREISFPSGGSQAPAANSSICDYSSTSSSEIVSQCQGSIQESNTYYRTSQYIDPQSYTRNSSGGGSRTLSSRLQTGASSRLIAAALRDLKQT